MNGNTNALHDSPPSQGPTTRRPVASTSSNRKTADGSNLLERGESTPHAFAPCNPTPEDPGWPPWLENSIQRLISAVRETSPPRAHSSAPPTPLVPTLITPPQRAPLWRGIFYPPRIIKYNNVPQTEIPTPLGLASPRGPPSQLIGTV